MRPAARVVAMVVLLGGIFGLCVHYDAVFDDHSPYPNPDDIDEEYDAHVGEEVFLFGTVRSVDESAERATIEVDTDEGSFELTVVEFRKAVEPGGVVQVHGRLEPDRTVDPMSVAVVNASGSSKLYKYGVSVVGAVLVLVVFFRHWRFDTDSLAFEVRGDG